MMIRFFWPIWLWQGAGCDTQNMGMLTYNLLKISKTHYLYMCEKVGNCYRVSLARRLVDCAGRSALTSWRVDRYYPSWEPWLRRLDCTWPMTSSNNKDQIILWLLRLPDASSFRKAMLQTNLYNALRSVYFQSFRTVHSIATEAHLWRAFLLLSKNEPDSSNKSTPLQYVRHYTSSGRPPTLHCSWTSYYH
jgi:hypothetical protein